MPRSARDIPPPLELLCLRALWTLQEGNVRDVQRIVGETRPLAYTTIMTVLDRLVRKGMLTRRKAGRAFRYVPRESRENLRRLAVRELLDAFFDGSEEELQIFLRSTASPSAVVEAARAAEAGEGGSLSVEAGIDTVLL